MPALLKEDLNKILKELKINKKEYTHFVETGTWVGETILNFINGSWLKRHNVEILMDERKKRSIKLNQLGI